MTTSARLLTCASVLMLHGGQVCAQATASSSHPDIQAWIDCAWQAARELPTVDGVSIRWRTEDRFIHSAAELDAMRREIENKPDHPKRMLVQQSERRIERGPDIMRNELWLHGAGAWRMGTDYADGGYLDAVWAPQRAWSLSPRGLTIAVPEATAPSANALLSNRSSFSTDIALLLSGGFGLQRAWDGQRSKATIRGTDWEFTLTVPSPDNQIPSLLVRYRGTWDPGAVRGFTTEVDVLSSPTRQDSRWEFRDWQWNEALQQHVPAVVQFVAAGFDRLIVFEGSRPEPDGGFEALTRIPQAGTTDPIRGEIYPLSVRDHRIGVAKRIGDDGQWLEADMVDRASGDDATRPSPWRATGIVSLVVIVACLVVWKWRFSRTG